MKRVTGVLLAFGIVAVTAAYQRWAHHYHYERYDCGRYGRYYNSTCNYYITQGDAWDAQGNYDNAIADYNQAIATDPNCARAYAERGSVWYEKGEYEKAIADDTQAIAIIPNYAVAFNNRAAAWDEKIEYDRAIADATQALAIDPSYAEALVSRGAIYYNKGDYDEEKAIADDNQAYLAINPTNAQAYGDRGSAWNMKGDYAKAQGRFLSQALSADANNAEFYNDLAFFQATCLDDHFRDAQKAFENASKAYQLTNGSNAGGNFSVLASVYAENGNDFFTKALGVASRRPSTTDEVERNEVQRLSSPRGTLQARQAVPAWIRRRPWKCLPVPSVAKEAYAS